MEVFQELFFIEKVLPLVFSLIAFVGTAVVKYQLEKAKHRFEVQSQFYLESHHRIWSLWEAYHELSVALEKILGQDCRVEEERDILKEYEAAYQKVVEQKRIIAPIISSSLDRALERYLELYEPVGVCNMKNGNYQKLHGEMIKQFREALK